MKKGFTLIELLAVIIILAIVALIATPIILDVVDDARESAGLSESNMIYSSINNYCASIEMKKQMGTLDSEDVDCSSKTSFTEEEISKMVNLGNATIESSSYANGKLTNLVVISNNNRYVLCSNGSMALESDGCEVNKPDLTYKDSSGANSPELLNNMIPIKYDGNNWVYADIKEEWYDYDKKEWANAVVLNSGVSKNVGDTITEDEIALWYVWIPRYTYTVFNGNNGSVDPLEIQIKFESGTNSSGTVKCVDAVSGSGDSSETCTDDENGSVTNNVSTYTHPAFTFGDKELTGFWVGKFEVSGSTDEITIKPNITSLREQTVSSFFNAIQNMSKTYSLNGDSHMMKNMEWGAVAYLSHSKYGTCTNGTCTEVSINSNNDFYTGGGISNAYKTNIVQSTTHNIYGAYDMSGNAYEYVMGNMVNSSGSFYSNNSGFTEIPNNTYYDRYTYNTSQIVHGRGKLGDATKETLKIFGSESGGWNDVRTFFVRGIYSWFVRGGSQALTTPSLFIFSDDTGDYRDFSSTRAVLCTNE